MVTSIDTTDTQFTDFGSQEVYVADTLVGDFILVPFLYCDQLERYAGPDIDICKLRYHYGSFAAREGGGASGQYSPQNLDRKYVRVIIRNTSGVAVEDWFGVIEVDERDAGGTLDGIPTGDQEFTAYGLLRELEREIVTSSTIEHEDGEFETIGRGIAFNYDPHGQYPEQGNNSGQIMGQGSTFIFGFNPSGNGVWTAEQAVNYLMEYHTPKDGNDVKLATWQLGGTTGALSWYKPTVLTDRRNVKEILDDLIDRRRGVGYWVDGQQTGGGFVVTVHVFTFTAETVNVGDSIIPSNPNQKTLNFENAFDVNTAVVRNNLAHVADVVRAEGQFITSTFSLEYDETDGFAKGWSVGKETEFIDGASGVDGYDEMELEKKEELNQLFRQRDEMRDVFSRFVISQDWDKQVRDISSSSATRFNLSPNIDQLENITETDVRAAYESVTPAPIWLQGKRFLRHLPIPIDSDDDISEFRDPFVLFRTEEPGGGSPEEAVWEYGDRLAANSNHEGEKGRRFSVSLQMLNKVPGIRLLVSGGPQQFIAKSDWEDADPAETDPWNSPADDHKNNAVDYTDLMAATVCIETDERVVHEERNNAETPGKQDRVLTILVPDARLDIILPGTITDIDDDGTLVTEENGKILRDDRDRLEQIAKAAALWYGKKRQALTLQYRQVNPLTISLGDLITSIGSNYTAAEVNSVISAIKYDIPNGTTTLETSYAELDLIGAI